VASPFDRFTGADAAKFVDPKNWGEIVSYVPAIGQSASLNASVSIPFAYESPSGVGLSDAEITMLVRAVDVPNLAKGDQFTVDDVIYYPIHWEPDGFGHVLIFLSQTQIA